MATKTKKSPKKVKPKAKPVKKKTVQARKLPAVKKALPRKVVASNAKPVRPANVRIELWSYDPYGQGSIVASGNDVDVMVQKARQFCTESNVENALAAGEKYNSWEAYFPELAVKGKDVLYAGNKKNGKHHMFVNDSGKWVMQEMPGDVKIKFFLGNLVNGKNKEEWYLNDHKGKSVDSFTNNLLDQKTVLFVRIV